jgi:hypothetical protein
MFACVIVLALPTLASAQPQCQPGSFASASTGACEPCDLGRYQPARGQDACFQSDAGRFADTQGRTACDACGPGRYQGIGGQSSCSFCEAGSFRDATGQTSCASCEAGRFAGVTGATVCFECASGRYADVAGVTACTSCEPGSASGQGAKSCPKCAAGEQPVFDATGVTCKSCPPGRFSGITGATTCDACPPGKFSGVTVDATGDAHYASTCTTPNAYNSYKAKDLKTLVFPPHILTVGDAYTLATTSKVKGPAMVCAPIDVGSGVEDSSARQCCYKVSAAGLAKPHPRVRTSGGAFTGSSLEVLKSQLICEPCGADLLP